MDNIKIVNTETEKYILIGDTKLNYDMIELIKCIKKCKECDEIGLKCNFNGRQCQKCRNNASRARQSAKYTKKAPELKKKCGPKGPWKHKN